MRTPEARFINSKAALEGERKQAFGDRWLRRRRLMQPAERVAAYAETMVALEER
jgi:hypothetical protein